MTLKDGSDLKTSIKDGKESVNEKQSNAVRQQAQLISLEDPTRKPKLSIGQHFHHELKKLGLKNETKETRTNNEKQGQRLELKIKYNDEKLYELQTH